MSNRLVKNSIESEIGAVSSLLAGLPENDIFNRRTLTYRLEHLKEQLQKIEGEFDTAAQATVYFAGKPVAGSYGIFTTFAMKAISSYQDIISAIVAAANNACAFSDVGKIPNKEQSELLITGTAPGSFGFVLEENVQPSLLETPLSEAIEHCNILIETITTSSEDIVIDKLSEEHPRVTNYLKVFFETLHKNEASLKIVSKNSIVEVSKPYIELANERTENIEVVESDETVTGTYLGGRVISRDFNFKSEDDINIFGKIDKSIDDAEISKLNQELQDQKCQAKLRKKTTKKLNSEKINISWCLISISPE